MMDKLEKITAYILLSIMIAGLLPIMYLGRYNHPTGDDYYYGAETKAVWEETGDIAETVAEAARRTAVQYRIWQGTYSAMFLMHLPPNIFSEGAYRFVTCGILLLLSGGLFYLLKPIIRTFMKGTVFLWITVSSLLTLMCVQTVEFQGESFFWYNGSFYYTGYFALTCVFFGLALRYISMPGRHRAPILFFLAFFLAGGNYVSLLPAVILLLLLTGYLFLTGSQKARVMAGVLFLMSVCFLVNALAPGNRVRQDGMWGIPAWKAIVKSLFQGARYAAAWTGIWLVLALLVLTPFLWRAYARTAFRFRYPLLVLGLAYGIFCSMSCPTFYAMNSTGPARVVAIVYYGYLLFAFGSYGYLLGYLYRVVEKRRLRCGRPDAENGAAPGRVAVRAEAVGAKAAAGAVLFAVLVGVQIFTGALWETTSARAVRLLASGEAAAYEREYRDRLRILEDDTVQDVVFLPYENRPDMLYVGDFVGDAQDVTNRKVAQYFHKRTVRVEY